MSYFSEDFVAVIEQRRRNKRAALPRLFLLSTEDSGRSIFISDISALPDLNSITNLYCDEAVAELYLKRLFFLTL